MTNVTKAHTTAPTFAIEGDVLLAIAKHRVLTTEQLRRLATPGKSGQWARLVLNSLRTKGLIEGSRQADDDIHANLPHVWWATAAGIKAAARSAEGAAERLVLLTNPSEAKTTLHTLAINELCLLAVEANRAMGAAADWTNEVAHPLNGQPRPTKWATADALLRVDPSDALRVDDAPRTATTVRYFVELDRGTKTYDRILDQHRQWTTLYRLPGATEADRMWHRQYRPVPGVDNGGYPTVLWCFDSSNASTREANFAAQITTHAIAADIIASNAWTLTTTLDRVRQLGVHGPAFRNPQADSLRIAKGRATYGQDIGGTPWRPTNVRHENLCYTDQTIESHLSDRMLAAGWSRHEARLRAAETRAPYLAAVNEQLPRTLRLAGDGVVYAAVPAGRDWTDNDVAKAAAAVREPVHTYPTRRTRSKATAADLAASN